MKVKTKITVENPCGTSHLVQTAPTETEKQLGVRHVAAQLPDTGCGSALMRDGQVYRIAHETNVQGGSVLRFQFLSYGNMVTVSVEFPEQQPTSDAFAEQVLADVSADFSPNQNGQS